MTKLREIMTREIHFCRVGDTLSKAAALMWDHDCGCVPVVDHDGKPLGMLTDRDICMAAQFTGKPLDAITVESAMSKQLFACKPDNSVETAEAIMRERQIRRIPIVEDGKLVGVLSLSDLVLAAMANQGRTSVRADLVDATLSAICQPRAQDGHSIRTTR